MREILSDGASLIGTVIAAVVLMIVKKIADYAVTYIKSNTEKIKKELNILKNDEALKEGKKIWWAIEENFRIGNDSKYSGESKAENFDAILKNKFPNMTKEDIETLRQSIAGMLNREKTNLTDDEVRNENASLKDANKNLYKENQELKQQLAKIGSLVEGSSLTK